MKNMSFSLTTDQIRKRTKTVTRRMSCNLKPGQQFRAIVKGMGLKKGQKVEPICDLVCISNIREPLWRMIANPVYGCEECEREGFPEMTPEQFVAFFCSANGCDVKTVVHRVAFQYA